MVRSVVLPIRAPLQRTQPLKEQAYQAIRTAILSGEFTPGQRLIETQLAKMLQVSRTPIREALRLLQSEDLVVEEPHNVLRVATFTVADALQLYDCRIALEQLSVAAACQHATDTQLQKLSLLVTQAQKLVQGEVSGLTNFQLLNLDYQFHRQLAESSGNLWLRSLLDQVFDKMMLLRIQTIAQNRNVLEIRFEHQRVYEAVRSHDPQAAKQAIYDHLVAAKTRVASEVETMQQNAAIS